jgi:hypothetical protein
MNRPSGDHVGSTEYSRTKRTTAGLSSETRKSRGAPSSSATDAIARPSGAHAGVPRNSSDSVTARASVPSAFIA